MEGEEPEDLKSRHKREMRLVMANKREALQVQLDGGLPALREYIDKLMREEQRSDVFQATGRIQEKGQRRYRVEAERSVVRYTDDGAVREMRGVCEHEKERLGGPDAARSADARTGVLRDDDLQR